jgi:preprotein translocase subunit SecA
VSKSSQRSPSTHAVAARHPFSRLIRASRAFFRGSIADPVETDLGQYEELVARIRRRDCSLLSDAELRARALTLRLSTAVEREVEIFALVREAARRSLHLSPFDVQLIAGLAMARGRVAELPTGEGKTLAAVFPACLHALAGRGVHILTFNDYLARRDAAWMGPVFERLGLSVGCAREGLAPSEKRAAYACDVTYATAKEAGFDFLRDRLALRRDDLVHRAFHCALVDEADSILVDEARIPLVIAAVEERAADDARELAAIARTLVLGQDFETDAEHRNVFLLEPGIERIEAALGGTDLYAADSQVRLQAIHNALHAEALLRRDIDYVVRAGRVELVDDWTGRVVEKRHWPDGLQAAVEAKEGVARRSRGRILGSITLQHFFGLYPVLAGMTATARSAAHELSEFYGLGAVIVPPHVLSRRVDDPDAVFADRQCKRRALVREIGDVHQTGRPILVGTSSVRESEELAADLTTHGIPCAVLNAKNDEREAAVVAEAGLLGAVTISTNMAGRGTDIKLGGVDERERERVVALGGLLVLGTSRHESLRIDRQLRGRSGRQGDPGSTRFFLALDDELFERYGLTRQLRRRHTGASQQGELSSRALRRDIEHVQRVIEGQSFDIRRRLTTYSALTELQRRIVQERRDALLAWDSAAPGGESASALALLDPELHARGLGYLGSARLAELERRVSLFHLDRSWAEHLAWLQDTRESIHLVRLGGMAPIDEFRKYATAEFLELQRRIDEDIVEEMRTLIAKGDAADADLTHLKGPSATWTYLISDDAFALGVSLAQTKNIGLAASMAFFWGPVLVLTLLLDRWKRRRAS